MLETVIFTEPIIKSSQLVVTNTESAGLICGHFWKRPRGSFLATCNAILLYTRLHYIFLLYSSDVKHLLTVELPCKLQEKL